MSHDREIQCKYYINEGNCQKYHKGTFKKSCQTCLDYLPKKGALPRRKNLKRQKNIKWMSNIKNYLY